MLLRPGRSERVAQLIHQTIDCGLARPERLGRAPQLVAAVMLVHFEADFRRCLAKRVLIDHAVGGVQRRVVGLASSQIATDVLAGEGLAARNISRWLASQDRLTDCRPYGDDQTWRLRAGDLVVVDESAMADTAHLAAIHAHCQRAGAKLLLTGDRRRQRPQCLRP